LRQAARQAPADTDVLYRLGYVEYRQRKLAPARQHFAAVVKLAPPAHSSRYFLGRIALLENKPREAVGWLEPVVTAGDSTFDAASQLARALAAAGESAKAIAPLRMAIASAPWDGSLLYRLGQLYRQTGENELAKDAFATSARLKAVAREDVESLMRTSELLAAGKPGEAMERCGPILHRAEVDPDLLVALGVIFGSANRQAEALSIFERAAAGAPALFQAQFNYGLGLVKNGRASEAVAPLKRAFELLPQSQEAAVTLGLAAVMAKQYAVAAAALDRAWSRDPANSRVAALLATARLRTGAVDKALPLLRDAIERNPKDANLRLLLVEALDADHDAEGALEAAGSAQRSFPDSPQVQMAAAQQLVKAGRYEQAGTAFEQVLKLRPALAEAELGLADSLQKSGRPEAALEHYRSAGQVLPARLGQARCLVALRRFPEAREVLERALPEFPSDPTLRLELSRVYARLGESSLAAEQARIVEQLRSQ
jgi:tetratricopeptide (TPR) repeat protein